jgi:hypothetical protein
MLFNPMNMLGDFCCFFGVVLGKVDGTGLPYNPFKTFFLSGGFIFVSIQFSDPTTAR